MLRVLAESGTDTDTSPGLLGCRHLAVCSCNISVQHGEGGQAGALVFPLIRALMPSFCPTLMTSSQPDHLPETPPLNTIT